MFLFSVSGFPVIMKFQPATCNLQPAKQTCRERAANYSITCMAESSHQELADNFNVPGESNVLQFEEKNGESESVEKTSLIL